jgi:protein-ribulosamine 3-kinase
MLAFQKEFALIPTIHAKFSFRRPSVSVTKCTIPTEEYLRAAAQSLRPGALPATVRITDVTIAPGQQNEHFRLDLDGPDGPASYLAKVSRRGGAEAFAGERASLAALASVVEAGGEDILINKPLFVGTIDSGLRAYSIFPWVHFAPFGTAIPSVQRKLAVGLARLHQVSSDDAASHSGRFGFDVTTYLGAQPQDNSWTNDWVVFFITQRLQPLLDIALTRFSNSYGTSNEVANALQTIGTRIVQDDSAVVAYLFDGIAIRPSLLHGDLFMGNCGATAHGRRPVMYDPASFYGHDEYDLALSSMWGRFSEDFYATYHEANGSPQPRFEERQLIYRLHYLLQMLVLHGPGFGSGGDSTSPDG